MKGGGGHGEAMRGLGEMELQVRDFGARAVKWLQVFPMERVCGLAHTWDLGSFYWERTGFPTCLQ